MSDHEEFNVESDEITDADDIETGSTMPLGVEGFGSDDGDLAYGAGGSATASKGWMVIVTVIVLAAGGLIAMHKLAKVTPRRRSTSSPRRRRTAAASDIAAFNRAIEMLPAAAQALRLAKVMPIGTDPEGTPKCYLGSGWV